MSEPPVPVVKAPEPPAPETLVCANCGAPLAGEYCTVCGQRHEPHVHTVRHFVDEAFEAISHADSRLWKTLGLLLTRPGRLTREFFDGHRVRYLPPFRLYIVLSILLALLSSLASSPDTPESADVVGKTPAAESSPTVPATVDDTETDQNRFVVNVDGLNEFCSKFDDPETGGGNVSGRRNIKRFCTRIRTQPGELAGVVVESIPRAMFVFLPLIAAIMKLMYWRPKRYYVEHLLFLVHNHAAVFLVYILVALYSFIPVLGSFTPLVFFLALGYLAWYVHRAMRVYYGQGGALTLAKYFLLFWIYVITAIAGFVLTVVFVAIWG